MASPCDGGRPASRHCHYEDVSYYVTKGNRLRYRPRVSGMGALPAAPTRRTYTQAHAVPREVVPPWGTVGATWAGTDRAATGGTAGCRRDLVCGIATFNRLLVDEDPGDRR